MLTTMNDYVIAEAFGVRHSSSVKCKQEQKYRPYVYLVEKNGENYLHFSKKPKDNVGTKVKCIHPLQNTGHNFIITSYVKQQHGVQENTIINIFSFRNLQKAYITLELGKDYSSTFGRSLKTQLQTFPHLISVISIDTKYMCELQILHITSRRICITTTDPKKLKFILPPKDIHKVGVEVTRREDIEKDSMNLLDSSYKGVQLKIFSLINPDDHYTFIIRTSQFTEIYHTINQFISKNLTSDYNFACPLDQPSALPGNTYEFGGDVPRIDPDTGSTVLTPSFFDKNFRSASNSLETDLSNLHICNNSYGKKKHAGARLYTYVDVAIPVVPVNNMSYEYIKLKTDSTAQTPVEVKELTYVRTKRKERKTLHCHISIFASKPEFRDIWCLYLIFTDSSDTMSFQKVHDMEKACEHLLLCPCRNVSTQTDLKMNWKGIDGFDFVSHQLHLLSYEDLEQLSIQNWLVLETHVRYTGKYTTRAQFASTLEVKPADKDDVLQSLTALQVFEGEMPAISFTPSQSEESSFPLPYDRFVQFCQMLDVPHLLHHDWRMFAHHIGISTREIDIIGFKTQEPTKAVVNLLTSTYRHKCNYETLKQIFSEMRRFDIVEILVKENEKSAIENVE